MYPCPARILKALITIYLKSLIALACVIKHSGDEIGNDGNECGNTLRKQNLYTILFTSTLSFIF